MEGVLVVAAVVLKVERLQSAKDGGEMGRLAAWRPSASRGAATHAETSDQRASLYTGNGNIGNIGSTILPYLYSVVTLARFEGFEGPVRTPIEAIRGLMYGVVHSVQSGSPL